MNVSVFRLLFIFIMQHHLSWIIALSYGRLQSIHFLFVVAITKLVVEMMLILNTLDGRTRIEDSVLWLGAVKTHVLIVVRTLSKGRNIVVYRCSSLVHTYSFVMLTVLSLT